MLTNIDPLNEHDQQAAWLALQERGQSESMLAMIREFGTAEAAKMVGRALAETAAEFPADVAGKLIETETAAFAYAVRLLNGSN